MLRCRLPVWSEISSGWLVDCERWETSVGIAPDGKVDADWGSNEN